MYSEENLLNTLSPKYPHTNFPVDLHTFLLIKTLREFVKKSKRFPLGDHFINFHNPSFLLFWYCSGKIDVGHSNSFFVFFYLPYVYTLYSINCYGGIVGEV